jgi:hypothetical protein
MNFIDRFKNGWRLFLNSLDVMQRNKSLLLFPLATAALTLVMAVLFLTPIALQPTGHSYSEKAHWSTVGERLFVVGPPTQYDLARGRKQSVSVTPQAYAYGVLFYFLSMFLATFFNVAFVHEIFNALNGEPVTVSDGLRFAGTKVKPILMWTLFAGVVGLLIRSLEQKFGFFGRWVVRLVGLAWSVASVFVIPVLVMEEHPDNPIGVVRQSAGVISKTWGEALAGYAGLQFGGIVIGFGSIAVAIAAFAGGMYLENMGLTFAVLGAWFVFICAFSYAMSVAGQIYLCVLYRYASAGIVPQGYTPEMLTMAWRPKKA